MGFHQVAPKVRESPLLGHFTPPSTGGRVHEVVRSPDAAMLGSETKAELADLARTAHKRLAEIRALLHDPSDHADMKAPATDWIRRRTTIGLFAPDIQKAMLAGTLPQHITAQWMVEQDWPVDWQAQRKLMGVG